MSYFDRIYEAAKSGGDKTAHDLIQTCISTMSALLQTAVNNVDPRDYPFLLVSLEMTSAQLRDALDPSQIRLAEALLEKTLGITLFTEEEEASDGSDV